MLCLILKERLMSLNYTKQSDASCSIYIGYESQDRFKLWHKRNHSCLCPCCNHFPTLFMSTAHYRTFLFCCNLIHYIWKTLLISECLSGQVGVTGLISLVNYTQYDIVTRYNVNYLQFQAWALM